MLLKVKSLIAEGIGTAFARELAAWRISTENCTSGICLILKLSFYRLIILAKSGI